MDAIDRYEILDEPDERGYVTVKRLADGKTATAKTTWFKKSPDGDGLVPRSRTKAIRLGMLDWE